METKKDIYNLWVLYTTKNDEIYFRQFVSGFVSIWKNQLKLNFDNAPYCDDVHFDSGPHLSRLPDELLPAIGKFIIIARDEVEREHPTISKIENINMLVECLVIICRHFDNINTIVKYDYVANLIPILAKIFGEIVQHNEASQEITILFENFSHLMEVIYDPYLTWRSYIKGIYADYQKLVFKPNAVHVEIVPFIYDCFQTEKILNSPKLGISLVNSLGSIIAGSQKKLTFKQYLSPSSGERKNFNCDNARNGMRAICPATVSVIINLISKWECSNELRLVALKCCSLMVIVLQRSSPEERQIDLVTIIELYCDAIVNLLKTKHFCKTLHDESFKMSSETPNTTIDVHALYSTVNNIREFIADPASSNNICDALLETNILDILVTIPEEVKTWLIDRQNLCYCVVNVLSAITRLSRKGINILQSAAKLDKLACGLKSCGKPSEKLLVICFEMAFDDTTERIIVADILIMLLEWIPDIGEKEQNVLSELIMKGCSSNNLCKSLASSRKLIKIICESLSKHKRLSSLCIQTLVKLTEELAKHSISPVELKRILWLLRNKTDFPQSKQLFQAIVTISLHNLNSGNICPQFLDIQNEGDGIIVPDIKKWTVSGSYGFIFHIMLRFDKNDSNDINSKMRRRMIFTLMTHHNTGFEIFIQQNGTLVVAAKTKKDYLTSTVPTKILNDGRWHYITVSLTPPKRPFSYSQINVYIDFMQKLSATTKVQTFNEPFSFCTIGSSFQASVIPDKPVKYAESSGNSTSSDTVFKGMIPSLIEKALFPQIASHVPNYFTLPLRNTSSSDPNVKNFPVGMQDNIFGEQICMKGQISAVLLAEPITNIKTIFDTGANFASILSQDSETWEQTSKFVFCYSAAACHEGLCIDLVPGGKFNGSVRGQKCQTMKLQDTINSIGGIQSILPILENFTKMQEFRIVAEEKEHLSYSEEPIRTPSVEEFSDWEVLSASSYAEWKMIQQPVACFLCFLRYLTHDHEKNQENLLNSHCIPIIGSILSNSDPICFDVNALMATHLFIESLQNQKSVSNEPLLEALYSHIVFNFNIWSRMQFQIGLGHVQYLTTMIKGDRKYFRKNFGIQFFLDTIREFYANPENISVDDAQTIRSSMLAIVRYYIQKEVNIKEVGALITFCASVKHQEIIKELIEMLNAHINGKNCRDQIYLLLHEPQTADLLYNFFIDKVYTLELQEVINKFIDSLLVTTRVHQKHKTALRLQETNVECQSLYPGFFSHLLPLELNASVISFFVDEILQEDADYCGLMFLTHHLSLCDISLKLEVAKKVLTTTFTRQTSPRQIAKQIGWQESIARLLIKRSTSNPTIEKKNANFMGVNLADVLLNYNTDFLTQADLISFGEQNINIESQTPENKEGHLIFNEIQESVTEAAHVIETEIKELAGSVSGAVAGNIASVYSVIRQRTSEIQDTFESLTLGASLESEMYSPRTRTSSNSSDETSSVHAPVSFRQRQDTDTISVFDFAQDIDVDIEEQLVYLVTNILFTILWRGVSDDYPESWKERGQVLACINLLALNNELIASHLTLRLRLLEMGVQAALIDLSENANQMSVNQENASQVLRMVYDLVVLDPNEDESKKCSIKLLDGVLALLDALMVFQQTQQDEWSDMTQLSFGLLLKCAHHPNQSIVAMATAKLHAVVQNRNTQEPIEMAFILFRINKALDAAIDVGNSEQYSFLMPVMKALLQKSECMFNLAVAVPDLPPTISGPVFFQEFQKYSPSKQWKTFIERKIKPLYDMYQNEISKNLSEPLNIFWAECYEACKSASQKRVTLQLESRRRFQQKIIMPWRVRQMEAMTRLNSASISKKTKQNSIQKRWKSAKKFLYGSRGPWYNGVQEEQYWKLSNNENVARMRLKLEPELYPNDHSSAANLRDNAVNVNDTKKPISTDLDSTMKTAVVGDFLSDDENLWLEEEIRNSMEPQSIDVPLEKAIISQECELVTLMTRVKGRLEVNQTLFTFVDLSPITEDVDKHDFRFPVVKIREVHLRKYNLRRSALEIFLIDQKSYFLNFTTKTRNKIFTKILNLQLPNILYGSGRSPPELLKASGLTYKWVNREISNFEYLMYLNTISGRSYNDLSQYPVFPWILSDYKSRVLDLSDPRSFRDLSKPVGVINPKNEADVRAKYEGFEDPSGAIPKFHYGTHYSNSAGVLHYLIRVEPFTSLHIDLQSGRFDVADRQFHSIPQTWKLLMDNPSDVKELIPEFFYFPEFLKNMNKFDLGHLQITKEKVDNVVLPPWASNPEEFIAIHRRALESEYVSQNLNHWIDLIFGYKQKGANAVDALNVFYYCSYEGAVDVDKISNPIEREALEGIINNFGQTPSQLLREAHPRRLSQEESIVRLLRFELKRPDFTQFFNRIIQVNIDFSTQKDPIVFLCKPRSPPKSFLQISPDILVSISKQNVLGLHWWVSFDKDREFHVEVDATTHHTKNRKRLFGPIHPSLTPNSQIFAVSLDGKYLYAGGIWDNSLRVFNLHKGKVIASVTRHIDIITCLALDNCGSYLVTGSKDCTSIVWSIAAGIHTSGGTISSSQNFVSPMNTANSYTPKPITTLYGHDDTITCVAIYTELNMVVSGSLDGTVNVYTIEQGQFIRTLRPRGCTEPYVQISYLALSYQGHIAFSAFDNTSHSIHIYSVNGTNLGSKYVSGRVTGLTTASDFLVVTDDAGDVTISHLYGLKPVFNISLHIPIQTVAVTAGNTHILAPLRDGRLAVIGVSTPSTIRKHAVLNL